MQSHDKNKYQILGWIVLAIALGAYLYFQILSPLSYLHCNDFKHLYVGAKIIAQGRNPYDPELMKYEAWKLGLPSILPYVYLPFTGIAMAPLTLLSFRNAALLWFWLNHALLFLSLYLMLRMIRMKIAPLNLGLWIFYFALFFPLTRNLTAGQLNVVLLFLFSLIAFLHTRGKAPLVGALTAFATLFKLSPGILFLYFLWTKKWRHLLWAVGFLFAFIIISLLISGIQVHLDFIPILRQMSYGKSTWEAEGHDFYRNPFNQSFNSLFHHLFTNNPYTIPWIPFPPLVANLMTMFISLALLFLVLFLFRKKDETNESGNLSLFALFMMLSLFLPSLCWDHYLTQAILPVVFLAGMIHRSGNKMSCAVFSLSLLMLAVPYNFSASYLRCGFGVLFMSLKLMAALGIFVLIIVESMIIRLRRSDSPQREGSDGNN
ncbi:DUF2029 domain-containing protein [Candidatus Sumerlaeota bacterium]|nr:DUF2029 domain-containing protein [Candidatus Sumerlaeota bacterium]